MARVQPVTDPQKIVTDALLLKELARQRVDADFVEFHQDYAPRLVDGKVVKGRSPYAKFYRDLKSRKRFMVTSALPKVRPDGQKVELGWSIIAGKYHSKPNLFSCVVDGTQVQLTCLFPQPWGAKPGDVAVWNPQLFVNGIEQMPKPVRLLAIDPVNPDLMLNTLEWDYGVCKRRIRLVHGRFRERWVFSENPSGDVRIKHNLIGNMPIKLGRARGKLGDPLVVEVAGDEEIVAASEFERNDIVYPIEVGASATYYPDAHEETSSVDGWVGENEAAGYTWAEIIAAGGDSTGDDEAEYYIWRFRGNGVEDKWDRGWRSIFVFDTSGLDDDATVTAATFSLYGTNKADNCNWDPDPDANVYSSAPASSTELAGGDYDSIGTTAYCDTVIVFGSWSTTGYNDFVFNATGIAAVSKVSVTKLGFRNTNYDVGETAPNWVSGADDWYAAYYADQGSNQPKLVVTYSLGGIAALSQQFNPLGFNIYSCGQVRMR